jgi:hypothetical protein
LLRRYFGNILSGVYEPAVEIPADNFKSNLSPLVDANGKFLPVPNTEEPNLNNIQTSFTNSFSTALSSTQDYYKYNLMNLQSYSRIYLGGFPYVTVPGTDENGKETKTKFYLVSSGTHVYFYEEDLPFTNKYCFMTPHAARFTNYIANPIIDKLIEDFEENAKSAGV